MKSITKTDTFNQLFETLFSKVIPANPFIYFETPKGETNISFKDLSAQSHCLAAYFVSKNISKKSFIFSFSNAGYLNYVFEIATQFACATSLTLSPQTSISIFNQLVTALEPRFILFHSYSQYLVYKEVLMQFPEITCLVDNTLDEEIAEGEKFFVLNNVVDAGKLFWRENKEELQSVIGNQKADDWAMAGFTEENGELTIRISTQKQVVSRLNTWFSQLSFETHKSFMISEQTFQTAQRYDSIFLPLAQAAIVKIWNSNLSGSQNIKNSKSSILILVDEQVNILANEINGVTEKGIKSWAKKVGIQKVAVAKAGQKPKFGLKFNYFLAKGRLIGVKNRIMPGVSMVLCNADNIKAETDVLFHSILAPINCFFTPPSTCGTINSIKDQQVAGTAGMPSPDINVALMGDRLRINSKSLFQLVLQRGNWQESHELSIKSPFNYDQVYFHLK